MSIDNRGEVVDNCTIPVQLNQNYVKAGTLCLQRLQWITNNI